ncbi:MAG: hypothetical protein RIQ33_611, partial [Bacteroidota bacterium]|jgi:hypothetical protein
LKFIFSIIFNNNFNAILKTNFSLLFMKKITLSILFVLGAIVFSLAQSVNRNINRCSTEATTADWDEWFNQKVELFKAEKIASKGKANTYVIPVVIHVIHGGQNVGTYPNISDAQVLSQIQILTDDFQGVGYNTNQYANMGSGGNLPFYNYAVANNLPSPNANGVAIANMDIQFKPAWVKPNGIDTLDVAGIDRVDFTSKGWTNPTSFTSATSFKNYMDGTIKPATIWNPTKYLNVWVSDCNSSSVLLLGYSTFPASSTLTGLAAPFGNSNTDGTWIWAKSCGDKGTIDPNYNKGRTLTHEVGHYFGLRHTWGDANCGTDYCNDVPPSFTSNIGIAWPTNYPFNKNTCAGAGLYKSNATDGEMFMNFMDYCDDEALWMFTNDQVTRMETALANSPNRSNLTASALLVCKPDVASSPELIAKQYLNLVIDIYPNPATNNLSIQTKFASNTSLSIVITNAIGQVFISKSEKNITSSTFNFDISNFAKGVYFITFTDSKGTSITKKLIKA